MDDEDDDNADWSRNIRRSPIGRCRVKRVEGKKRKNPKTSSRGEEEEEEEEDGMIEDDCRPMMSCLSRGYECFCRYWRC